MPTPLLPTASLRKHCVIYLADLEREQIRAKAAAAKLSISAFIRLAALGQVIKAPPGDVSLKRWQELARTTANLNQLVASINSGKVTGIDQAVIDELAEQVRLLRLELLSGREGRS